MREIMVMLMTTDVDLTRLLLTDGPNGKMTSLTFIAFYDSINTFNKRQSK